MVKRRKGFSLVSLSLCVLVIMVMATFIIYQHNPDRIVDDGLTDLGCSIDTALSQWYLFHSGAYPENLSLLQNDRGLSDKLPIHKFVYTVNADRSKYRMEVILYNRTWTTPGSNL